MFYSIAINVYLFIHIVYLLHFKHISSKNVSITTKSKRINMRSLQRSIVRSSASICPFKVDRQTDRLPIGFYTVQFFFAFNIPPNLFGNVWTTARTVSIGIQSYSCINYAFKYSLLRWMVEQDSVSVRKSVEYLGPSTLATLFNHMWPRIVADPSTLGRHVCYVCKRSVCGGDEPQPVAHLSHKLQCARQSLKIMVSYGNKYPRHNAVPHVVEQSGQCARAL